MQQNNSYAGRIDGMASRFTIQPQLLLLLAPSNLVTPDQIINLLLRHTLICKKKSCHHILTSRLVQAWQLAGGCGLVEATPFEYAIHPPIQNARYL
jgi:hypothetical protein